MWQPLKMCQTFPVANNESSKVLDIIKPGRRVKKKVTGSKISITSEDSLFASRLEIAPIVIY